MCVTAVLRLSSFLPSHCSLPLVSGCAALMAHVLLIPLTALRCRQAEPWRRPIQSFRTRLCLNATNLLYFTRYFGDDQQIQRHWEAVLKIYQAQMWFMQVVVQSGPVLACILFCSFKTFPFKASSCSLPTAR